MVKATSVQNFSIVAHFKGVRKRQTCPLFLLLKIGCQNITPYIELIKNIAKIVDKSEIGYISVNSKLVK